MKKLLFYLTVCLLFSIKTYSQIAFQKTYGVSMMDMFYDVKQTSDDGFILSGMSMSDFFITFDGSLVKTDATGDVMWAKVLDAVTFDPCFFPIPPCPQQDPLCSFSITDVQQISGGYILTGYVNTDLSFIHDFNDLILIKTDNNGTILWSKRFGGSNADYGYSVKQTLDLGFIVTGSTYSFSAKDSSNIFLLKTNSSGTLLWDKTYEISTVDDDVGMSVEVVSDGYVVAGYTQQITGTDTLSDILLLKTNIAGTLQWIKTYGNNDDGEAAYCIKKVSSGDDLLLTGYTTQTPFGFSNTLLMKINSSNGNVIWSTSYYMDNFSLGDEGHSIFETSDGNIAVIGFSINLFFGFFSNLIKTTSDGNTVLFSMDYDNGFLGMQMFSRGQQTSDGGYVIGNMGPGLTGWDYGLIKTDANGISGCNEQSATQIQNACSFTPITPPVYLELSGSHDESFDAHMSDVTPACSTICCSPLPDDAGAISGEDTVCQGDNGVVYSVAAIPYASSYEWGLPAGASGSSTTNSITIDFSAGATSGNLTVYGTNDCGMGLPSTLYITVNSIPDAAGVILGPATACQGQSGIVYTVPAIPGADSYTWTLPTGATGSSTTNSITVDFGGSATDGNITVFGTNDCGDGAQSTLPITIEDLPVAAGAITGAPSVCQGDSGEVYTVPVITDATSYVWTLPSGVSVTSGDSTNSITVDFSMGAVSGDIIVFGINSCGQGEADTLAVIVSATPVITITENLTICTGDSTTLTASGGDDYQWSTTDTTTSIIVNPNTTTTYNVTVTTGVCSANDSVTVTVLSLPAAAGAITGVDTVCQGDLGLIYYILSIADADSYVWTLPPGATIDTTAGDTAIIVSYSGSAVSGDITVYGTNFCGEGDTAIFQVTVNPAPVVAIYGANISCYGESDGSSFVSVLGSEPFTYLWTDSLSTDSSITNLSDGLYWVTVTDNYGCSTTTDVNILQPDSLSASITTNNVLCYGDNNGVATVFVSGGTSPYIYDWSDGQTNSSATGLLPGNYSITVTDDKNCEKIKEQIIISEPTELIATIIDSTDATCFGENNGTAQVGNLSGGTPPYSYEWSDDYHQSSSIATNLAKGIYYVTVTDNNGCYKIDSVNISEICIEIPTAFTPNNDGAHDTWEIKNIDLYPNVTVEIYNRWGQLIYENKGYKQQDWWDGTNNKGKPLPIGSYIYIVNLNDNSSEPYNGIVTIIR